MTKILDLNVRSNFYPIWTCFGNIIRKLKKIIFPASIHKHNSCCRYRILKSNNLLAKGQGCLRRAREISMRRFLLEPVLNEKYKQRSALCKQKSCDGAIKNRSLLDRLLIAPLHGFCLHNVLAFCWGWRRKGTFTEILTNADWSKKQHVKLRDLSFTFQWNYTYNFENIFTIWSYTI